ncbi:glycosyltransferase family 25 protein [endosymbiont GvMRE of Glomus versiforme]|uniref:glycosyltransferase family 25 protein n=1 Tax=endosymbiont GvMRE of Glomus versiforme TaxID=2039283 RepID=UPI000EBAD4F5|nr:glycosyltransferase family 25 protein [endosymbiont GvMRE of Glomus versiforme]RHZ35632.1 Glycosyltransferase family 25 [endosymbiont GvMRE of Glomus versiforme]
MKLTKYKKSAINLLVFCFLIILLNISLWFSNINVLINRINSTVSKNTLDFDHIYVINLPSRKDRREMMESLSKYLKLDFDFVDAVPKEDFETLNEYLSDLEPQYKACYISHYRLYGDILKRGYRSSLILEDDVDIELNITDIMNTYIPYLPKDWELFYIGQCGQKEHKNPLNNQTSPFKVYKSESPFCTHAYAVSFLGAQNLLNLLINIKSPIDLELVHYIKKGKISSFTLEPSAIVQWKSKDNPSDISPEQNQWTYPLKNSTLHFLGYHEIVWIEALFLRPLRF